MFGHMAPEEPVEIVSYRVRGIGLVPPVEMPKFKRAGGTAGGRARADDAARAFRWARSTARSISASGSTSASTLAGPAILDQFDCTTVICPGQTARVDEWKNLIVTHPALSVPAKAEATMHMDRRGRSRSGEGEPLRHRAGDAELAVPHRLLDHRARVAGCVLRADEREGRGGGAARGAAAAYRRVSGLHRRRHRCVPRRHRGRRRLHHQPSLSRRQPHAPDIAVITPVFVGGELFGFCGSIAHKSDIGGPVPGSCSGQAREIFNEGLHLPAVRYQRGFRPNADIERLIGANSRTPELVLGDIRGQLGADRLGEKRLDELVGKFGRPRSSPASTACWRCRKRRCTPRSPNGPDGRFEAERFVDDDGIDLERPVRIHVVVDKAATRCISISAARPTRPRGRPISARRWCRRPAPTR